MRIQIFPEAYTVVYQIRKFREGSCFKVKLIVIVNFHLHGSRSYGSGFWMRKSETSAERGIETECIQYKKCSIVMEIIPYKPICNRCVRTNGNHRRMIDGCC